MPDKYPFLSDEWMAAVVGLQDEHRGPLPTGNHSLRMNQVITGVPFGDGVVDTHMDSSSGVMEMGRGHVEDPDVTITLDYETAREVFVATFVEGDAQAAMQAFMAGRIKVQGDMAKLLAVLGAVQQATPDSRAVEVQRRIKELTE